jgi:NDP-sugar pyrophosphorylase family protein
MTLFASAPRAVILAAGLGSRLRPFTTDRPKPLVRVHDTPILLNALRNLAAVGVQEATLVVGYRSDAIQALCGNECCGVRVTYVESSVYDRTGSAYSLWLARETLLQGDALLLEGDVFFEAALLHRLMRSDGDTAAVDEFDSLITDSAALVSTDGTVSEFRMNQSALTIGDAPLYKTVNLYRFTASTLREVLVPQLDALIASGNRTAYVEQFLAQLLERRSFRLTAAQCRGARWFEIDNHADLRRAEEIFLPEAIALEPLGAVAYVPA